MNHFMKISSSLRPPGLLRFVVLFSFEDKSFSFSASCPDAKKRVTGGEAETAEVLF